MWPKLLHAENLEEDVCSCDSSANSISFWESRGSATGAPPLWHLLLGCGSRSCVPRPSSRAVRVDSRPKQRRYHLSGRKLLADAERCSWGPSDPEKSPEVKKKAT